MKRFFHFLAVTGFLLILCGCGSNLDWDKIDYLVLVMEEYGYAYEEIELALADPDYLTREELAETWKDLGEYMEASQDLWEIFYDHMLDRDAYLRKP